MDGSIKYRFSNWRTTVLFGLAYFVFGYAALLLAEGADGIAFVWPASGVAVAGVLLLKMPYRLGYLALVAIGGLILNIVFGNSVPLALGFTVANIIECVIVGRIACLGESQCGRFNNPGWSLRFLGATILGSLSGACFASAVFAASGAQGVPSFFVSWLSTVILGILIVAPAITEMARAFHEGRAFTVPSSAKAISLAAVVISTAIAFLADSFALLFVPFVAVVFATFALRTTGAIAGLLIVALGGTLATAYGSGPVSLVGTQLQDQVTFLQFYLLMILICVLPIGSLLSDALRDADELKLNNRLLAKAEGLAHVGHWRFEVGSEEVLWSDEVYRIHAMEPGTGHVSLDAAIAAYHPHDLAMVNAAVERAMVHGEEFQFEARILCTDGSVRHVHSQGEAEIERGKPKAVFGVILDITDRKEAMQELSLAHQQAEESARTAQSLAETDQLTGIANRRRLMNELQDSISAANVEPGLRFSFAMIDIDDFKVINDTRGHPMGDAVLVRVAQLTRKCLREHDVVGRLGGEEFGIILRGADKKAAARIAERIRETIEKERFEGLEGVSVSLGLAEFAAGSDLARLVQSADSALYVAKRSGKNQLQLAA